MFSFPSVWSTRYIPCVSKPCLVLPCWSCIKDCWFEFTPGFCVHRDNILQKYTTRNVQNKSCLQMIIQKLVHLMTWQLRYIIFDHFVWESTVQVRTNHISVMTSVTWLVSHILCNRMVFSICSFFVQRTPSSLSWSFLFLSQPKHVFLATVVFGWSLVAFRH